MDFPCTQKLSVDLDDTFQDEEDSATGKRKCVATLQLKESFNPNLPSKEFPIYEGRHGNCDISIPEGVALSKKHACIEGTSSMSFVYDCGSSNKTRLKKVRLKPEVRYALNDGDELSFADIKFIYKQSTDENDMEDFDEKTSPFEKIKATPAINKTKRVLAAETPGSPLDGENNGEINESYPEIVPDSQPFNSPSNPTTTDSGVINESVMETVDQNEISLSSQNYQLSPGLNSTKNKLIIESDSDSTDIEDDHSNERRKAQESNHYDSDTDVDEFPPPHIEQYNKETDIEDDKVDTKPSLMDSVKHENVSVVSESDDTDIEENVNDSFSILETQTYHDKKNSSKLISASVDDSFAEYETQGFCKSSPSRITDEETICTSLKKSDEGVLVLDGSFAASETQAFATKSSHVGMNNVDFEVDGYFSSLETQAFLPKPTNVLNIQSKSDANHDNRHGNSETSLEEDHKTIDHVEENLTSSHEIFSSPPESLEDTITCDDTEPIVPSQCTVSTSHPSDLVETPDFVNSLLSEPGDIIHMVEESQSFAVSLEKTQPVEDETTVDDLKAMQDGGMEANSGTYDKNMFEASGNYYIKEAEKEKLQMIDGMSLLTDRMSESCTNFPKKLDVKEVGDENIVSCEVFTVSGKFNTKSENDVAADCMKTQVHGMDSLAACGGGSKGSDSCIEWNNSNKIHNIATVVVKTPEKHTMTNNKFVDLDFTEELNSNKMSQVDSLPEELPVNKSVSTRTLLSSNFEGNTDLLLTQVYSENSDESNFPNSHQTVFEESCSAQNKVDDNNNANELAVVGRRKSNITRKQNKRLTESNAEPPPLSKRTRSKRKVEVTSNVTVATTTRKAREKRRKFGNTPASTSSSKGNEILDSSSSAETMDIGDLKNKQQFLKMEFEPVTIKCGTPGSKPESELAASCPPEGAVDDVGGSSNESQFLKMEFEPVTIKCGTPGSKPESELTASCPPEGAVDDVGGSSNESQFLKMEFEPVTVKCDSKLSETKNSQQIEVGKEENDSFEEKVNISHQFLKMEFEPVLVKCDSIVKSKLIIESDSDLTDIEDDRFNERRKAQESNHYDSDTDESPPPGIEQYHEETDIEDDKVDTKPSLIDSVKHENVVVVSESDDTDIEENVNDSFSILETQTYHDKKNSSKLISASVDDSFAEYETQGFCKSSPSLIMDEEIICTSLKKSDEGVLMLDGSFAASETQAFATKSSHVGMNNVDFEVDGYFSSLETQAFLPKPTNVLNIQSESDANHDNRHGNSETSLVEDHKTIDHVEENLTSSHEIKFCDRMIVCKYSNKMSQVDSVPEELPVNKSVSTRTLLSSNFEGNTDLLLTQVYSENSDESNFPNSHQTVCEESCSAQNKVDDDNNANELAVVDRRKSNRTRKQNKRLTESNTEPSPLSKRTRSKRKVEVTSNVTVATTTRKAREKRRKFGNTPASTSSSKGNEILDSSSSVETMDIGDLKNEQQFLKMEFEPVTIKCGTPGSKPESELAASCPPEGAVDDVGGSSNESQFLKMEFEPVTIKCGTPGSKPESELAASCPPEGAVDDVGGSSNESQFLKMEFEPVTVKCDSKLSETKNSQQIEVGKEENDSFEEKVNISHQFLKMEFEPVLVKCDSNAPADGKSRKRRKRNIVGKNDENALISNELLSPAKKIKSGTAENYLMRKASLSLRPRKLKPKVVFTGLVDKIGETIIRTLGGSVIDDMHECTHLVTDKIRRTVKFLCAMVKGVYIVAPGWLRESQKFGRFVSEMDFQLKFDGSKSTEDSPPVDLESQYDFNLSTSLRISRDATHRIFHDLCFHVMKSVLPPPEQMKLILECGGGKVMRKLPGARDKEEWRKLIVIATQQDETACLSAVKRGACIVSNEFVLTGILRQKLELEKFQLFKGVAMSPPGGTLHETKMNTRKRSKAVCRKNPKRCRK